MKTQERACSFEEQIGLLPEMSSPDILSGGGSGTCSHGFPSFHHHHNSSGYGNNNRNNFTNNSNNNVKQEVINLDEYTTTSDHQHNQYFQTPMLKMENTITHSMPSTSEYRCYLHRTLSLKKDDYLIDPYVTTTTETSSLSDFNQQQVDDEEAISGLESLDWNALYEAPGRSSDLLRLPANASSPALPKNVDPAPVLLHLKRQNSDIFSSLELWNYSQIAQELWAQGKIWFGDELEQMDGIIIVVVVVVIHRNNITPELSAYITASIASIESSTDLRHLLHQVKQVNHHCTWSWNTSSNAGSEACRGLYRGRRRTRRRRLRDQTRQDEISIDNMICYLSGYLKIRLPLIIHSELLQHIATHMLLHRPLLFILARMRSINQSW